MATSCVIHVRPTNIFELEAIESLPCGCVAADYWAPSLSVGLVAVEAKGPYCTFAGHALGRILHLANSVELETETYREGDRP